MIKKRLLYIFFFFIIIKTVICGDLVSIYSGFVYPGKINNISNEMFDFDLSSDNSKLMVTLPTGSSFFLYKNSSEIRDGYQVYYNNASYWYHNYTLDKEFYKALVIVYRVLPDTADLELTRTFETTDLLINEETKVDVIINNKGKAKATNIVYIDKFPKTFEITQVGGALIEYTKDASAIKWTGSLSADEEEKISYKIKALAKADYESIASLSYNNGTGVEKSESESVTIAVPDYYLSVSIGFEKDKIEIGEDANLNIKLQNTHGEEDIKVDFSIEIPQGLKVKEHVYLGEVGKVYSWKSTLEPGDSKSFKMVLEGVAKKIFVLQPDISFRLNDVKKNIEKPVSLNVGVEEVVEEVKETVKVEQEEEKVEQEVTEEVKIEEEKEEQQKEMEEEEKPAIIEEQISEKKNNLWLYITIAQIFLIIALIILIRKFKRKQ